MTQESTPDGATARFAGFTAPTYTTVPNELFDDLLPVLSGAELKALLYIVRRTFGFKRESDAIALSQMVGGLIARDGRRLDGGTGLSRSTLVSALKSLEQRGVIVTEHHTSTRHGFETTVYRLAMATTARATEPPAAPSPSPKIELGLSTDPSPKIELGLSTDPSPKIELALVRKSNLQETVGTYRRETDEDSLTHVSGADAPAPAQKQRRATPKKDEERTAEQREDTRILAAVWMKANDVDPATALGVTIVQYNAWAHAALKHRDRETLIRFLRWMYTKRRHEGAQFTIVPRILDERIGQWLALPGKPEQYKPPPDKKDAAAAERRRKDAEAAERQEALYRMQMAAAGLPV